MLYVFTGDGKGKTTSALGIALRALGYGHKVIIVQFMKSWEESGEVEFIKKLSPAIELYRFGREDRRFVNPSIPEAIDFELAQQALAEAKKLVRKHPHLLILDEINVALKFKLLKLEEVLDLLDNIPEQTHVIFTGRGAYQEIIDRADLVTEMKEVKHPYHKGIKAQKGLDY